MQLRGTIHDDCKCREIHLVDLASDKAVGISEDCGSGAQGCHLVTETAAHLEGRMSPETDVLIITRSGRAESEGAGMRAAIGLALAHRTRV